MSSRKNSTPKTPYQSAQSLSASRSTAPPIPLGRFPTPTTHLSRVYTPTAPNTSGSLFSPGLKRSAQEDHHMPIKKPRSGISDQDFFILDGIHLQYAYQMMKEMKEGTICGGCFGLGVDCEHNVLSCPRSASNGLSPFKTWRTEPKMNDTRQWCFGCGMHSGMKFAKDLSVHPDGVLGRQCSYVDGALCVAFKAHDNNQFRKVLVKNKGADFKDFGVYTRWIKGIDGNAWDKSQATPTLRVLNMVGRLWALNQGSDSSLPRHPSPDYDSLHVDDAPLDDDLASFAETPVSPLAGRSTALPLDDSLSSLFSPPHGHLDDCYEEADDTDSGQNPSDASATSLFGDATHTGDQPVALTASSSTVGEDSLLGDDVNDA